MREIALDMKVARTIAQILRDRWTGAPLSNTVCHALSDIITASMVEKTATDLGDKNRLLAAIEPYTAGENVLVDIQVRNGVAELRGIIPDERTRYAILNAVSTIDGISHVHDHLIDIDCASGTFLLSDEDAASDCNLRLPVRCT